MPDVFGWEVLATGVRASPDRGEAILDLDEFDRFYSDRNAVELEDIKGAVVRLWAALYGPAKPLRAILVIEWNWRSRGRHDG